MPAEPEMAKEGMVFSMLLRIFRSPSRIDRAPEAPLLLTATRTRLASLLGGTGRLAKVNSGNLYSKKSWLWQEVRASVATAIKKPQMIWAWRDLIRKLRFFNGN